MEDGLWDLYCWSCCKAAECNPTIILLCSPDQRTFRQHMEEGAITSGSQSAKKLGKRKISKSNAEHGTRMDKKAGKIQRLEQQSPSVSSMHNSKITVKEKGSATYGSNKNYLREFGENLIKILISAADLNEEQLNAVHIMLSVQVKTYLEVHDHSKDKMKGVRALTKFITKTYGLLIKDIAAGSLIIVFSCQRIESLEHLWHDYLCGHLDKVAERYLVTNEMKKRLNLETITLKTTIEKENYLNCRKVLMDCSGETDTIPLFSQQGGLDPETSMIGKVPAGGEAEVLVKQEDTDWLTITEKARIKQEDTDWMFRKEKARVKQEDTDWMIRREKAGVKRENTDWLIRPEMARVKQENTDWMIKMEKARASRSALHTASINGQYVEVKKYLSSGYAVDVKDQFLLTPLHLACWYGQESVVKLLLEYGADVNATDKFQFTSLHKAERRNHESIVKLLLDHNARPTLQQPPNLRTLGRRAFTRTDERSGFNLLQAAVLEGDAETVRKAIVHLESFVEEMNWRITSEKASIFPRKSAADILATVKGKKEGHSLFGIIYEQFVETDITLTELHSCAKRSDVEMVIELVLNYGMDVNVAAKRNITPLLWASPAASSLSIKTLIDLGADVNAQTSQDSNICFCGRTALHSAIHANNAAVVEVLLSNKADANIGDQQGNTALHSSTSKRFFNISQLLIYSGCKINGRNDRGETPLCSAVRVKNVADVKLLLQNNVDANLQDTLGNTPLHISTREGFSKISQLLRDSGCKINGKNFMGETPLHSAVRGENVADVKLLLNKNADANLQNTLGDTPLHISTNEGFFRISLLLIGSGCETNRRNYSGRTALHCAVRGCNMRHVELLLGKNADASIQDTFGNSSLHMSSRKGFSNISQLLIFYGCENNVRNNKGETPLYCAVLGNNAADVKILLKNNANTNIQDTFGNTPLHVSSREGFSNISKLLIDSGCEINVGNSSGETPVYCAVRAMNVADVELLLENNAITNIQDTFGNTPLHVSLREGFSNISQLLIDSGCEVKVRNHRGETPLHSAVCGKNEAAVKLLLKNNADSNIQDYQGNTPLHISLREGFSNISQLLIDSRCNKNLKNLEGKTPLEVASFSPLSGDVEEDKGNRGYASQKSFPDKSFLVSEDEDDPWMNQPTRSTLSSPSVISSFPLMEIAQLQPSEGSEPGTTRKRLTERTVLGLESFSRRSSVSQDFKGSKVYAPQESFQGKTFFETEDVRDLLMEKATLSTRNSPIVVKRKKGISIEGSSSRHLFKKQLALSSSAESEPGAPRKHFLSRPEPVRSVSSRGYGPLTEVLSAQRQELLSGDETEPAVKRKLERTKGGTSRRETSGTNPPPDEK
ncbi:PREDICTED: ankyrin-1-like isoform X2 [Acropora digitifera]|uniref:ankyrin-1-like isoform X2 n=1 Tax=Acropora digitifera TaxID=70779 RepID=UPI00077AA76D|nr:PREDICTED: ankyrin-1-like isoform X2 [Acropora digitifera]